MKALVVEDEKDMRRIISMYLQQAGFEVGMAANGQDGLEMLCANSYELAVVDWMMPVLSGIDFCEQARKLGISTKIIMLTAKSTADDELQGLATGADDYIKKPFDPRLLVLRAKKLLHMDDELICGGLAMRPGAQAATLNGNALKLTKKEYDLLRLLMHNQGIVLPRGKLLEQVWGAEYTGDDRTVDTHIRRLRQKIGEGYITTHVGMGYSMEKQA